ncbi:MAG: hypothetical protein LBU65_00595 [Planctomycetaceae bacterium]|jgi:hypothetical protein|nr:hypothetical protein [Planctomycetaceae bacterium]
MYPKFFVTLSLLVLLLTSCELAYSQEGEVIVPDSISSRPPVKAADEIDRNAPPPNKYDMNDRRNYKFGYRYNYRPPAQWTANPPSAGTHHYNQYRRQFGLRGTFGPYFVPSPTPGYPPVLITPERGAIVTPPIY